MPVIEIGPDALVVPPGMRITGIGPDALVVPSGMPVTGIGPDALVVPSGMPVTGIGPDPLVVPPGAPGGCAAAAALASGRGFPCWPPLLTSRRPGRLAAESGRPARRHARP